MRSALTFAVLLIITFLTGSSPTPAQEPYGDFIAKSNAKTPEAERKSIHLPPGFEIELVASEPAIGKPINLNFDDRGRIWITQSVEYPFAAPPGRKPRDEVRILESTKGDGQYDKVSTFVDDLNIPICVLPFQKGAIVHSIPNIYRIIDSNGSGRGDKREILYGTIGHRDTHGMTGSFTLGFDGWIYACHGYANTSEIRGADGSKIVLNSGNTYRMKPDGSHVEQWTHGQVNPFGLTFDPLGNLYSADCHSKPLMMLLRGAYYQSFGKPHDGLGYAPEMCAHDHGSTAICGITYYAADQFPPAYRDTIYIGNVVTNRINHDKLEAHGSSYRAVEQPDFLKCDDPWFRPVDIKLGPDGALYVADFYNRIIGHYEVPLTHPGRDRERGRIWRIVYRGADGKSKLGAVPPDLDKATVRELSDYLANTNLTIRIKAMNQMVARGGQDVSAECKRLLAQDGTITQKSHALWVLERMNSLSEDELRNAAREASATVRVHCMHLLAERGSLTADGRQQALDGLKDVDGTVRRAAADALATHADPANVRPLIELLAKTPGDDSHLVHTLRMAVRNQLMPAEAWPKVLAGELSDGDKSVIADVSTGVASAEAGGFLFAYVQKTSCKPEDLLRFVHHIARHGNDRTVASLLTFVYGDHENDLRHQAGLLKSVQQGTQERGGKLNEATKKWADRLARKLLESKQGDDPVLGAELAGSMQMRGLQSLLLASAGDKANPEHQRRSALSALAAIDLKGLVPLLGQIVLDASEHQGLRENAVQMLGGFNNPDAHAELLKALAVAPAKMQNQIAAGLVTNEAGAEKLLAAVTAGKASARLLQEWVVHIRLGQYPKLKEQIARLTQGLPTADQRLQELLNRRRSGFSSAKTDPAVGAKVFEKSCAICHQLGGKGSKIGPQLDGLGVRGLDRILEDIIDPNRNVDQAFRSTTLALKNGQVVSGLVLREEGEVVILADAQGKEVRIPKGTIEERTVSQLSPMPANLVEQITEADFYHLMAYLLAQAPNKK